MKSGLDKNSPQIVVHSRVLALGVGLIKQSTVIIMLGIKLHIANIRKEDKIGIITNSLKYYRIVRIGTSRSESMINEKSRYWKLS